MSGPIFGLCSEHLSVVFRDIGFIRSHPIHFRPLSSTIDYLSIETFQQRCSRQQFAITVRGFILQCSCYFAPVTRHSVQTMCTMFSRKDFLRMFDGLLRISTRKTNAEPRCLTSLVGHNAAICAETPRIGPCTPSGEPLYGFD